VIEVVFADIEKSGVIFGEVADAVCGEACDSDDVVEIAGLTAGRIIRKDRLNSTRIFVTVKISRGFEDR